MATKGHKLREELQRSTLGKPPWTIDFSCSNLTKDTDVAAFCEACFASPFQVPNHLDHLPQATLIVGAGKLDRSKFEEQLPKWVTSSLLKLAFVEDQSASGTKSSQGRFKFQHDTGENLKYIKVYCKIVDAPASDAAGMLDDTETDMHNDEENSAGDISGSEKAQRLCIESELGTFEKMTREKVGGWAQKKRLEGMLRGKLQELEEIEKKLTLMLALSKEEQKLFDSTDRETLEKKITFLKMEAVKLVDAGQITHRERPAVVEQIENRIRELEAEKAPQAQIEKARSRLQLVSATTTTTEFRHPLREEAKMKKIWERSIPLEALVEKAGHKGKWNPKLTPEEVYALGEKEEMDLELERLSLSSRFWFEEDDEFRERVEAAKKLTVPAKRKASNKPVSNVSTKPSTTSSGNAWIDVARRPASSSRVAGPPKASSTGRSGAFAALADSDSD